MSELIQVQKPSSILRETTLTQCKRGFHNPEEKSFCAFAVLMTRFGYDGTNDTFEPAYAAALESTGMDNPGYIFALNTQKSFPEIADELEKQGL